MTLTIVDHGASQSVTMRKQVRVAAFGLAIQLICAGSIARGETQLEAIVHQMPENSWARVNVNEFWEAWTPPDQRPIPHISPASNISEWSGAAWDSSRRWLMIYGGGVGLEMGNEVYYFDTTDLRWRRGSLPSAMILTDDAPYSVDGTDNAPRSGESWDNLVYLENLDRFMVINASWNGPGFRREDGITPTGPYFWDPSRVDATQVGGTTGSQVKPDIYPDVLGARMWQNRDTWTRFGLRSVFAGVSATTTEGGVDVVYWGENPSDNGRLFKATFRDLDPLNDEWEVVGARGVPYTRGGAGTYDSRRHAFIRIAGTQVMYWDLNTPGAKNYNVFIEPSFENSEPWPMSDKYGIDYDPKSDLFVLWAGSEDVWWLDPPDVLGPEGWRAYKIRPRGEPPVEPDYFIGVYGKWMYMPDEQAFIGVVDGTSGDVWVYRPPLNPRTIRRFVTRGPGSLGSDLRQSNRGGR